MLRLFLLIITFCYSIHCYSKDNNLRFSRIRTEDGLSASWVCSIYQDKYGFMWFGTSDGLNRYDGYEMKVFKPGNDKLHSLVSEGINHIGERNDHLLWICTIQGVNVLDIDKLCFYNFPYLNNIRVTHVMTDRDGKDWFSTYRGLYVYNRADSSLTSYSNDPDDPSSLHSDQVSNCFQDKAGNIWVATGKGVDLYRPYNNSFFHFTSKGMAREFIQDKEGRIWVGYNENGLDVLRVNVNEPEKSQIEPIADYNVNSFMIDKKNRLWVGQSKAGGVSVIDLNTFWPAKTIAFQITGNSENTMTLSDNTIACLYADRQGGIWIGTYAGGVNYYNHLIKQFNQNHDIPGEIGELKNEMINCFFKDGRYFWIGTESGLYRLETATRRLKIYKSDTADPNSLGANGVLCIEKDSRGNLWIGTWNGYLNRYNYRSDNFTRYLTDDNNPSAINNKNIFVVHEDRQGNLLIGTNGGGLNIYNYMENRFRSFVPDKHNARSISNNAVNDICETSDGSILVSVYHALEVFDCNTGEFKHYKHNPDDTTSLGSGIILDIFEDSRKNIWIGTSNGLNLMKNDGTFIRYTMKDGLPNNTVQSIQEDNKGNLWLGTNNGLCEFTGATQLNAAPRFLNYYVDDGLTGNEFVRRSVYKHTDGWLYFGGTRGYTMFHPDSIFENYVPPVIVLTDFSLIGTTSGDDKVLFNGDVNNVEQINLKHEQCNFRFRFAALNYINPGNNRYRYILNGYEEEWHDIGGQREATYTNIDPGRYTFQVSGCNNDGVWSLQPKSISLIIRPPWWETWVFRISLAALLITLVYIIFRMRLRMLQIQKRNLEDKVAERTAELSELNTILEENQEEISIQNEELSRHRTNLENLVQERTEAMMIALKRAEEADRLKSAFLANMSHEIRTPMNAIVGFAALLNGDELDDQERKEFTEIISNNCNTLMVLINDILEISLIEANQIKLKNEEFDTIRILEELESYFKLNNKKGLDIKFVRVAEDKDLYMKSDPTRFRQIFTNLLNNAYKYTDNGLIHFGYSKVNSSVEFYVRDSGIGIDESEYQNIFNFFHKINKGENQLYRGAGIGLSISNKLVELMGGKIWLKSKVGEGTTFFLSFGKDKFDLKMKEDGDHKENSHVPLPGLVNRTILVAEDDTNNYMLIERILKKTGAQIVWAKNGLEAVNFIRDMQDKENCLVIMDIKMPVMSGLRASEEIRKICPGIPIIAVTAYAQVENRRDILKQNFVDYIAKPLKPKILLEKLDNLLKLPEEK